METQAFEEVDISGILPQNNSIVGDTHPLVRNSKSNISRPRVGRDCRPRCQNNKYAKVGKLYIYDFPIFTYMVRIGLNLAETRVLRVLANGPVSMKMLEKDLGGSFSWTFRCLDHLRTLGFVQISKDGRVSTASISTSILGSRLATFLRESDFPKPELALKGLSLRILPLLSPDGATAKDIVKATSLSARTVASYLRALRGSGIITYKMRIYTINPRRRSLIELVRAFSEHMNISTASSLAIPYAMLWQGKGEFLISVDTALDHPHFLKAADTALDDYGNEIIHRSEYYLYSPIKRKVSKAEAYVQAIVIDPNEPRMARALRKAARSDLRLRNDVLYEAKRYGIEGTIKEVLSNGAT